MKSISTALNTHLQGELTTLVACAKITLTKYQPKIVAISNADPCVVETRWAHDFETGDTVRFIQVRGMTALNRHEYAITRIDATHFSIDLDTTAFDSYTHKGIAQKVFGQTAHYKDLTIDGVLYRSQLGYSPDSLRQGSNMQVDSIEHKGVMQNAAKQEINGLLIDGISDEDLMAGKYDNARVEVFQVNYNDLSMGKIYYPISGRIGEVTLQRGTYTAELPGKTAALQEELQEIYSESCRADLGDDYDGSEPEHEYQPGFGCKVRLDPPFWQAAANYTVRPTGDAGLGSVVKPSNEDVGRHFVCAVAGISGTVEPAWNVTVGGSTLDGTVEWTTIEALTKTGVVTAVIDRRRFIDSDRYETPIEALSGVSTLFPIIGVNQGAHRFTIAGNLANNFPANNRFSVVNSPENDGDYAIVTASNSGANTLIVVSQDIPGSSTGGSVVGRLPSMVGFFTFGLVTFLDGKNKGISREVKAFSVSSDDGAVFTGPGLFEVFERFPFDIQVGDKYEANAGCDKSLKICVERFDNVFNRRAEDDIPGQDKILLYPDAK